MGKVFNVDYLLDEDLLIDEFEVGGFVKRKKVEHVSTKDQGKKRGHFHLKPPVEETKPK